MEKLRFTSLFLMLVVFIAKGQNPKEKTSELNNNTVFLPRSTAINNIDVITDITALEQYTGQAKVLYCADPQRGGMFVFTPGNDKPNNGTLFSALGKGNGLWSRNDPEKRGLNINWFGAVGDGISDNTKAIQDAIDYASISGGGTVYIPIGKYGIRTSLVLKNNVILEGTNKYNSQLYALGDNYTLVIRHTIGGDPTPGYVGIRNLCLWGYGDRNMTQGNGECRLARIGNSSSVFFENVYGKWGRNMGLTASGDEVTVTNCELENIFRDGINVTECIRAIVTNNRGKNIEDDFIAAHVASSTSSKLPLTQQTIVSNNEFFNTQGIVVLGARNASITGNTGRFIRGRGIAVGADPASSEGFADALNIIIANNTIADMINTTLIGRGNAANAIQLTLPRSTAGKDSATTAPAEFNKRLQAFQKPDASWNYAGLNKPHGANMGIIIIGNSVMQTLNNLHTISDAGYGLLWTTQGPKNINTPGNISFAGNETAPYSAGISIGGAVRGMIISDNFIHGFRRSITFDSCSVKQNIKIQGNIMQRSVDCLVIDSPNHAYDTDVEIFNNTFDLDPYLEAKDRNSGGWRNLESSLYAAIAILNAKGVKMTNNTFKNCKKIVHFVAGSVYICENNYYICDPIKKTGIGSLLNIESNKVVYTDSDPKSPNFNQVLSIGPLNKLPNQSSKNK